MPRSKNQESCAHSTCISTYGLRPDENAALSLSYFFRWFDITRPRDFFLRCQQRRSWWGGVDPHVYSCDNPTRSCELYAGVIGYTFVWVQSICRECESGLVVIQPQAPFYQLSKPLLLPSQGWAMFSLVHHPWFLLHHFFFQLLQP